VDCAQTVRRRADPIVHPGHSHHAHLHDFFGPKRIPADAGMPGAAPLSAQPSSCQLAGDRSAYWMPTLITKSRRGQFGRRGGLLQAYYTYAPGTRPYPDGLRMIAGDMDRTVTDPNVASWSCMPGGGYGQTLPPPCPAGHWLLAQLDFPSCWDGVNLDSADHRSHMAYPDATGCPASHPVVLPRLTLFRDYKQDRAPFGNLLLSSGSTGGLHADFISGWRPDVLTRTMLTCPAECGHLKTPVSG